MFVPQLVFLHIFSQHLAGEFLERLVLKAQSRWIIRKIEVFLSWFNSSRTYSSLCYLAERMKTDLDRRLIDRVDLCSPCSFSNDSRRVEVDEMTFRALRLRRWSQLIEQF